MSTIFKGNKNNFAGHLEEQKGRTASMACDRMPQQKHKPQLLGGAPAAIADVHKQYETMWRGLHANVGARAMYDFKTSYMCLMQF